MSLASVYTNDFTKDRLFLIKKIGTSLSSLQSRHALSVPIYRAILVTEMNDKDPNVNNMVVSAKLLDDDECNGSLIADFKHDVALSAAARSSSMVDYTYSFRSQGSKVVVFEHMGRGTIYSVMVRKFLIGNIYFMHGNWVIHLLKKFLNAMENDEAGLRICASQLFISEKGDVKIGYGATLMAMDEDPSQTMMEMSWPYMHPLSLWDAPTSEQMLNTLDVDRQACLVWHFGLTALELLYCGIRAREILDLHHIIANICSSGHLPHKLPLSIDVGDAENYTSKGLPIHNPSRAAGLRFMSNRLSKDLQKMIIGCLMPDPSERTPMAYLLAHPLFTTNDHLNDADLI